MDDWTENKKYILESLHRIEGKFDTVIQKLEERQTQMERKQAELDGDIKVLKAQAALAGAGMGFIASIIVMVIKHFL